MTTQALKVESRDVPYIWHHVKPLIDKALVHSEGELLSEDVLKLLLEKREHLFIGRRNDSIESALVGEVIKYPRRNVFRIITWSTQSGFDSEFWLDYFDVIEDFARSKHCASIEAYARKGLARTLKWDNEYSVISKELN